EDYGQPRLEAMPRRMREITELVAEIHHLRPIVLIGQSRERHIAWPRQEAFHLCYELRRDDGARRYSMPRIGVYFGYRDHTTVLPDLAADSRDFGELALAAGVELEIEISADAAESGKTVGQAIDLVCGAVGVPACADRRPGKWPTRRPFCKPNASSGGQSGRR